MPWRGRPGAEARLTLLLWGCAQAAPPAQCPDLATTVPASIGAPFLAGLTGRLAGPDRENGIAEAIAEIRRRDPSLGSAAIVDILLAADCPNMRSLPGRDIAAERERVANLRAQVEDMLGNESAR